MSRSKLALVVGVVALAVPLVAASGAQADTWNCAFTGATGSITPDDQTTADGTEADQGVESIRNDRDPANGGDPPTNDTDTGGYTFDTALSGGRAVCLFVDNAAGENPATTGVYLGHIRSEGRYRNVVCGTGSAGDDALINHPLDPDGPFTAGPGTTVLDLDPAAPPFTNEDVSDVNYGIRFFSGQGDLDITAARQGLATNPYRPEIDPPGPPDGVVNIDPTAGDCVNTDVSRFQASGAFSATNG